MWSDYYRHRSAIMKWIQHSIMTSHSRYSYLFVTEPDPPKNIQIKLENERCEVLDGGIALTESSRSIPLSCTVVHDLFNEDDEFVKEESNALQPLENTSIPCLIRKDFSYYLMSNLDGTNVSFSRRLVTKSRLDSPSINVIRPVLRINFGEKQAKTKQNDDFESIRIKTYESFSENTSNKDLDRTTSTSSPTSTPMKAPQYHHSNAISPESKEFENSSSYSHGFKESRGGSINDKMSPIVNLYHGQKFLN